MALSPALLKITITSKGGAIVLDVISSNGKRKRIKTNMREANMGDWADYFYDYIGRFQKIAKRTLLSDWDSLTQLMRFLHNNGAALGLRLLGESGRQELENIFIESFGAWESSGLNNRNPHCIEFCTNDIKLFFPLEFIPVFNYLDIPPINNSDDLRKVACRFPAFSSIIKRLVISPKNPNINITDTFFYNDNGLRIRYFHHANLPGAEDEEQFFKSTPGIKYLGPWPNGVLEGDSFRKQLSALIWNGYDKDDGTNLLMDHIQHFSCHCDTSNPFDFRHSIILAARLKEENAPTIHEHWISLNDLTVDFAISPRRDYQSNTYPLIFLNACGTAKNAPRNMSSFPSLFLTIQNRGFIGTEAHVPDQFAADFSRIFYNKFMQGLSIGQAFYETKWHLLLIKNNPLGVLYSFYTNPDARLFKPTIESPVS